MNLKNFSIYINRMANKARVDRGMKYRVIAIAFTKKGNYLGISMNGYRLGLSNSKGSGDHAEMKLIKQFGKKIDKIFIMRFGKSMSVLPIHPCDNCSNVAKKLGIKIISIHEELDFC